MRLASRTDLVLLGGLAMALFVGLSSQIGRVLDYAQEVDRSRGLRLLPALVVLTGVFIFHLLRKRQEMSAAARQATARVEEMARLVGFGQALSGSLDLESIRTVLSEQLGILMPGHGVWAASYALGLPEPEDGAATDLRFPMLVAGASMGELGIASYPPLSERERGVMVTAAALLGVSIKNAELFREVHENSVRDALTGCFRRKHALIVIETELRRAQRSHLPLWLVMFDIDHFKRINDRYGHLCGDAVLAWTGQCMNSVLRSSDVKCRYGGDEFLILLPESPLAGARRVADSLRRAFEEDAVRWDSDFINVTASFGLTAINPGEVDIEAIIGRADAALYRAKQAGRNCVRAYEELVVA